MSNDEVQSNPAVARVRRQPRLNASNAKRLIADWEASGLSAEQFCQGKPVTVKTLLRWRARLRSQGDLSRVVVAPSVPAAKDAVLRVHGRGGLCVELPLACDDAVLRRVCQVLAC